ncbi:MAG: Tetratricopeptide TPR_2 repeat protein [Candidatus Ozemobacter sibiricus]|uniref:Tetratricopeptide TPR_2 repeat protein n=1 Tax=Candidatus Ozemobacter sibiricus TaxID=2268124 RepID=A0A367ZMQ8_9BACT|nr:MAG: Tetratricopeptide TPR_2 repeat protein [Candidatus Ozemobacter sibiricus]
MSAPDRHQDRSFLTSDRLFLLAVVLLTIAAYVPTLAGGFVFDEHNLVLGNPRLSSWDELPRAFFRLEEETTTLTQEAGTAGRYRPLPTCLGILAWQAFGANPFWWRLINLVLALVMLTAATSLFRRLCPDPWVWRPAALFFALHPVHVEAISWVSLFGNTLLGVSFVLALHYHIAHQDTGRPTARFASLAALLAGLLSREGALAIPVILLAWELIFGRDPTPALPAAASPNVSPPEGISTDPCSEAASLQDTSRRPSEPTSPPAPSFWPRIGPALQAIWPALATVALYLAIRWLALGGTLRVTADHSPLPWNVACYTLPIILLEYLRLLFVPLELSPVYPVAWVGTAADPRFWGSLMAVIASLVLFVHRARLGAAGPRPVWFGLTTMGAGLLPYLHLRALAPELLIQDRYLLLASFGFCLLLALAIRGATTPTTRRGPALTIILGLTLVYGALTFRQTRFWQDDLALFTRAAAIAPTSGLANQNLGMALLLQGRLEEAEERFRRSLALGQPAAGLAGLGDVAFARGQFAAAVEAYEQALASCWNAPATLLRNLGLAYVRLGEDDQALRTFDLLAARFPDHPGGFLNGALLRLKRQEPAAALEKLARARALAPHDHVIPYFMGEAYDALGDRRAARQAYRAALRLAPGFERAAARLADLDRMETETESGTGTGTGIAPAPATLPTGP